ncbi:fungal-specific transcription factor domain-containing protein [Phaeosphaeriaceae sp. PMI808]|nr:fungal-specific transcription factor domain-containing protein [Phaeosphaeriaceae sp. PMI808]
MKKPDDERSECTPIMEDRRPLKRRRISEKPHREVGLMRTVPGDKFSSFVGSASGIYFIRSVYGAMRHSGLRNSNSNSVDTPVSDVVPGEDDQLPSALSNASEQLWRDEEITSNSSISISYQDFVEMSGSYFANWHSLYPFLHAPSVLGYFEKLSSDSPSTDRRQAGGSNTMQYPAHVVFSSYDIAVDSLQHVLTRPTSILGLQAAMSVQIFLVSMLRLNAASRLGGLINRMALQLGLHRCPARYASFSAGEKQIRRRIFWALYAVDRFICQSMGLPLGINDDDIDVCFPAAEMHVEEQQELLDHRLRLLDFVARESKLRGQIIELRNKSLHYVHKDPNTATTISAQLARWWNDVEDLYDAEDIRVISPYHRTILILLKHESMISLHRPILAASRRGAGYEEALQICIGSARSIITTLYGAIKHEAKTSSRSEALTLMWPSCTWAVWISSFILFFAASSHNLSHNFLIRLTDQSLQVLHHLARRGSSWPEASATAIRDLRSRIVENQINTIRNEDDASERHTHLSLDSRQLYEETLEEDSRNTHSSPSALEYTQVADPNADYGLSSISGVHDRALPSLDKTPLTGSGLFSGQPQNVTGNLSSQTYFNSSLENNGDDFSTLMLGHPLTNQGINLGNLDHLDPFSGFDIPFWFEHDQHSDIFRELN